MALQTNLNVSPYFDDFNENKQFYKVLFKPGVSVQVRELNQIQTIFQNQIEKFGDNIFKSGAIISGVNFNFNPSYQYVRISDLDVNGVPTIPSSYVGLFIESTTTNLKARVIEGIDGYETTSPNTKTLYIEYVNSGNDGDTINYSSGEILTISNANNSLFSINVNNGGSGFTNNDTVIISGSLAVNPLSGNFNVGDTITQGDTGSIAVVTDILQNQFDTANNYLVLRVTPRTEDLNNLTLTTTPWNFSNGYTITNGSGVANVAFTIGRNASAAVVTDASGYVVSLPVTNIGYGYTILPNVVIKPTKTKSGVDTFSATGINYVTKIKVPSGVTPSGTGYSMSVTEGYIYQKSYFLKVEPQSVIVNKYNDLQLANNVSVVFETSETIINSNIDTSLLDNIINTSSGIASNANAPGADRMQLVPKLTVVSTDDANSSELYYSLVDFSEGKPFKQNRYTAYNEINNELARRTNDEAGSYVTDEFIATSRSTLSGNSAMFSVVVDPGKAYISGYRVETVDNYFDDVTSGIDTVTSNSSIVSLSYGNFIRVSNMGGYFNFNHGDTILFDSNAVNFITNNLYSVPTAPTSYLAKANIRSVVLESGVPGTSNAVYRVYLFNLIVSKGYNFKYATSIYFVPAYPDSYGALGVADIVLDQDPVTAAYVAQVQYANTGKLLFSSGTSTTLQNANNVTYTYRTSNNVVSFANTGLLTVSYSGSATDSFPYTGTLSQSQMMDLTVVPSSNLISYSTLTGGSTATISRGTNTVIATGGAFISEVAVGDYLYFEANGVSANINPSTDVNTTSEYITVLNNPFPENSPVTYLVAAGNTAISGLSNNATYYILNSNSSAFQLASSSGNTTPINITAGLSETGHQFSNSSAVSTNSIRRIVSIANNTQLQLNSNSSFSSSVASVYRVFPKNIPMPFGSRTGLSANVTSNSSVLTLNAGVSFRGSSSVNTSISYNVVRTNIGAATKTPARNIPVKITTQDNPAGSVGPWCLGCPDIFRLRTVKLNGADVTSHFYVDHNQNPDFLDLGYLYKEPKSSLVIDGNSELIVIFDAFINPNPASPSYFVSQSYVGSNSAQQFINDSLDFNKLDNTVVNTNEVPELYSNKNGYYNLLNQIDFRPSALPTINVYATDVSAGDSSLSYSMDYGVIVYNGSIPIRQTNPVSTVIFANNNVTSDLYLPLPDSTLTADFTYYVPRIDNIVVNKNGTIDVIKGAASKTPKLPAQPVDTMMVDNIFVPDYPSIPKNPSTNILKILDTKTVSEKYSTTRLKSHIIENLLSSVARSTVQPKGYTMSDIGELERRIKDIEYYISLSQLEQNVTNKIIPSSISQNVDRFKYGFFVDDFSTSKYSDTQNPQYAATITFNTLYPLADNINLTHGNQNHYSLNVSGEQAVIVQNIASYLSPPVPCLIETGDPYALTEIGRQQNDTVANGQQDSYYTPRFTSKTATATLYFYTYNQPISIFVKQAVNNNSTTFKQVADVTSATALTASDVSMLKSLSYFSDSNIVLNTNSPTAAGGGIVGCGKITFAHNPVSGRYYNIQTKKLLTDTNWRWLLVYPVDTNDYIDCFYDSNPTVHVPITTTPVPVTTTFPPTSTPTRTTSTPTPSSSVTIAPTIIVTPNFLDASVWTIGSSLSEVFSASGGTAPYSWSVSGLTDSGLGVLGTGSTSLIYGGIPVGSTPGYAMNFTVTATDANGFKGVATVAGVMRTSSTPTTTPPATTTPVVTPTTIISNSNLYLKSNGMSTTGTGLIDALHYSGFDPISGSGGQSNYGGVNITNWTSIKSSSFGSNYVIDNTEDAAGKFRSVYIPSSTVASAIRYDLYQKTGINYQIMSGYSGASLVDVIHSYYITYMNRIPELIGLYYWISLIIVKGNSLSSVQNAISQISTGYKNQYGSPFDFRYNTSNIGVDISNYSIPSVAQPSYQSYWAFVREGSLTSKNYTIESVPYDTTGLNPVYQYYYDSSFGSLTKQFELYAVPDDDTLLRGLNKRFANEGGAPLLTIDDLPLIRAVYELYWTIPTSTSPVNGFGRAPDLDGLLYWVLQKYSHGYDFNTIKTAFFSPTIPEVASIIANGTNSVPLAKGTLSNSKATNYILSTNAPAVVSNVSVPSIVTTPNVTTAPPISNQTNPTASTSTGSLSSNTTSSLSVSGTNNNGFVQPTAQTSD